ncbi:hypothetical protein [Kitasatospora sp. NPDC093679]|uniref:hypothetical protein n=1 Tax=Kitasatospora sp. NPDC093679 TaxID=3154983 RepID=UPI0034155B60
MPLPRGLRKECEAILAKLPIPNPFSVEAFAEALAQHRERPIVLEPLPETRGPDAPSGLWVRLPSVDVVLFETRTSLPHQTLIKLHELGHIAAGHQPQLSPDVLTTAFPDVDPELLHQLLAMPRAGYNTREEQQAELIALLLADHLGTSSGTTPQGRRLTESLTHPVRARGWRKAT